MHVLPGEDEYRWLAKQRPRNKRQNRTLLLNSKKASIPAKENAHSKTHDIILPQCEVTHHAN